MGGIKTDIETETPITGLYAAGECSCISVHGANRLGGNSTADCLVFGAVAGQEAAKHALSSNFRELPDGMILKEEKRIYDEILGSEGSEKASVIRDELRRLMSDKVWIFRQGEDLQEALKGIRKLRQRFRNVKVEDEARAFNTDLTDALQLDFMLELAEITAAGALARTKSRGAHSRPDFPKRDDKNWLKHTLAYRTKEGPQLDYVPVKITKWPPVAREY